MGKMDDELKFRFDILDRKLDDLTDINKLQTEKLHGHDLQFSEYNRLLDKHIEGTELNRKHIALVEKELHTLEQDVEPIKKHVEGLRFLTKVIVSIGTLAGSIYAIIQLLGSK